MYFFYIDESGNRDVKKTDEPYVLAAVGMYERQWPQFNKHLTGMKTNIARKYDPNIGQDQLEVKANLLTKPYDREDSRFFRHLTADDINHISTHYLEQLDRSKMAIIAIVIDKSALSVGTTPETMHLKAFELLLERIQNHMWNTHRKHNALIIMDHAESHLSKKATFNRKTALLHARFLGTGNENMDFRNIVEYPFFVSSELSNGVQLADIVAYTIYHSFKNDKPDYPYLKKILPRIARHKNNSSLLAGLKVWPDTGKMRSLFREIQDTQS